MSRSEKSSANRNMASVRIDMPFGGGLKETEEFLKEVARLQELYPKIKIRVELRRS